MDFGHNLIPIRKQKKLSQAELNTIIGTSGDIFGIFLPSHYKKIVIFCCYLLLYNICLRYDIFLPCHLAGHHVSVLLPA